MSRMSLIRLGSLGLIWGSVFLWIKVAGHGVSPVQMVLARLLLGAAVLLAIGYARHLRLPKGRELWIHLTVAALLGNAVPWVLFAYGERSGSSGIAGVVNSTTPLWTVAAALLLGQEKRLASRRALGLTLGVVGTVVVASPWNIESTGSLSSIVEFVIGTLSLGTSFAYMGRFLMGRGIPPLMLAAAQLTAASGLLLLATPFAGLQATHLHPSSIVSILILGLFCTGLAYVINFQLIMKDGATIASTATYLFPVVSVLLGGVVLDEPIGWQVYVGAVIMLCGVALIRMKSRSVPVVAGTASNSTTVRNEIATRSKA
jgi:drug/metabolite transporter (DMT)-like permease